MSIHESHPALRYAGVRIEFHHSLERAVAKLVLQVPLQALQGFLLAASGAC
jgi:hypothetical protein